MADLALVNIGTIISGDLGRGVLPGNAIAIREGRITAIGSERDLDLSGIETIIDAKNTTVAPGLIDSHCHVVFGDYTPRQKTVDFLDSYLHGGITSVISPGEIHLPGRPRDPVGVKALAITAQRASRNFRPSGVKVHGGAVVIEPGLTGQDFRELAEQGVWLAKYGFGDFTDPADGEPQIRWAQQYGIKVMCHSGGTSIPGCLPITAEHLIRLRPDVCGHANGGTTALPTTGSSG